MSKLMNEASIPVLLREMSVEEKIDLLVGKTAFSTQEMPKYGIPSIRYLDGATGVNMLQYVMELAGVIMSSEKKEEKEQEVSSNESGAGAMDFMKYVVSDTPIPEQIPEQLRNILYLMREKIKEIRPNGEEPGCFPPGMLLGATWNPQCVSGIGEAVAREAMAYQVDVLLGTPNTNIQRDPKNGRVFESFSEDPYLSSVMAPVFAQSVQEQGMVADVKHYAANNQETLRQGIDETISERALREIYLPGFEAAVKEGKAGTVMSAYNSINGVPCAQNHWLLTEVLKEEWGFAGQVVSDWGAVYDQVEAFIAGNDLDMPGPRSRKALYEAVADGRISMDRVDDAVERTLKIVLKSPAFQGRKYTTIDNELSRNAAYQAAVEGITLLKNDHILPLAENTKVALYGPRTNRFMESGSGSAQVDTSKTTSLPVEIARYTNGVTVDEMCNDTELVIITAGASGQEGKDRPDMDFDSEDKVMLGQTITQAKAAGKKVLVLLNVAGPVELEEFLEDIDALLCLYFPGMEGARATADILFGQISPSGKLPITFPKTYRQTPTAMNFPGEYGRVNYGEGIYVGYRYYDYKGMEPLFPFGYGMTYTTFTMSDLRVSAESYNNEAGQPLQVMVTVGNEGAMAGGEVVQLYIHSKNPTLQKPEKELKAFQKIFLLPGEEKQVTLELMPKSFASYDVQQQRWTVEPGEYELLVGDSSRNIICNHTITITGRNPYGLSIYSTIQAIMESERAVAACEEVLGERFDRSRLKSNVTYFGSTPLIRYLEKSIGGTQQTWEEWKKLMETLREKLEEEE